MESWLEGHTSPTLTQGHLLRKEIAVFRAGLGFLRSLGCSFCQILVLVRPTTWRHAVVGKENERRGEFNTSISGFDQPKSYSKLRSNQEKLRVT